MAYINDFKDPILAQRLLIKTLKLENRPPNTQNTTTPKLENCPQTFNIMEVCGTHTMSIYKHGIDKLLPSYINLLSGPGCPVCVTDTAYIDMAAELALQDNVIIATFGDMLRVPGSTCSLSDMRAQGMHIQTVYSPLECIALAKDYPDHEIVFLAVGFETTTPVIALTLKSAIKESLHNLSMLFSLKTMPHAMENLILDKSVNINAFICPGHVAAIIGTRPFEVLSETYQVPMVIAGFERLDLISAIYTLIQMKHDKYYGCQNLYKRVVKPEGSLKALSLIAEAFEPASSSWRGIGTLPQTGLTLKPSLSHFNAALKFNLTLPHAKVHPDCMCGDVLRGLKKPIECLLYQKLCTPSHPIGACMVSSEGTCMNYYKYNS